MSSFIGVDRGEHRAVYRDGTKVGESDGPPVIEGGDCVVKLSVNPDPWPSHYEILSWGFAPPEVRVLLVPVAEYAPDGQWLLMPYADGFVSAEERDAVEQQFLEAGIELGDIRRDNMGYYNGEPRVLDYGFRLKRNAVDLPDEYRDGDPEQIGPRSSDFFETDYQRSL
jgi:hypothetical protein